MSQTKAQLISDLVQALNFTGTSSAPANGAFLSAANTLALATNSAQRLTINSSGNVGVGTVTPTGTLSLSDQNPNIRFDDEDTSNNGEITLDNTQLRIEVDEDNAVSSSVISFRLDGSEKARIASSGNVGIGATNPLSLLHVRGSGTTNLRVDNSDDGTAQLTLGNTGSSNLVISQNSANATFSIGGSERMRIDSSGRLGIGTNSPNTKLDVRDSSGTGISSRSTTTQATDSNKGLKVRNNSDTDTFSVSYKGQGYFAGNVGIGTATPDSPLHVHKGSAGTVSADGNAVLALENSSHCVFNMLSPADKSAYIMMGDPDDINAGQIRYDNNINELLIEVNGSERLRIDDSGKVGIGTSSPSQLMELASTAPNIRLTDTVDGHSEVDGNAASLRFIADKGNTKASTTITFLVDNTERVRIDDTGTLFVGCTAQPVSGDNGAFITSNSYHVFARNTNSATSAIFRAFGGAGEFRITGNGNAKNTNNNYAAISDKELKENIVDANSQWDDIKALKVRNYNFKESTGYSTHKQIGVVAQELEALGMNGLVATDDDELYTENDTLPEGKNIGDIKEKGGTKSVAYSVLYMKGIKALQEAMAKIETLETKVAALEAA